MSIATTILVVATLIGLYYIGMIGYDLYAAKMLEQQSDIDAEESIDVSDQLNDFESHTIQNQDESTVKKRSFISWISKGLSSDKMKRLQEDAAKGTENEELKNIMFMCDSTAEPV